MMGEKETLAVNQDVQPPTFYIDQVYKYLKENVVSFLDAVGR